MLYISQIVTGDKKVSFILIRSVKPHFIGISIKESHCLQGSAHRWIKVEGPGRVPCREVKWKDYLPENYIDYVPNRDWHANICRFQKL